MNSIISLKDFRLNSQKYIDAVKKGESFLVVKRSKPAFRIVPPTVDEWGDEGEWETVVDFTKINPEGVPAHEILKALKEMQLNDK